MFLQYLQTLDISRSDVYQVEPNDCIECERRLQTAAQESALNLKNTDIGNITAVSKLMANQGIVSLNRNGNSATSFSYVSNAKKI